MRLRVLLSLGFVAAALPAAADGFEYSGTLETYFQTRQRIRGLYEPMSWGELRLRANSALKATLSTTQTGKFRTLDEACVDLEKGPDMMRLGRFRTRFGFSDWSELFYNGFNRLPLLRVTPIVDRLRLMRDDAGAEFDFGGPNVQAQVAVIDTSTSDAQIQPVRARAATARVEHAFGALILGLNGLANTTTDQKVIGLDARWSMPTLIVRAEAMKGLGGTKNGSGAYIDASYRIPSLLRTHLVGRIDHFEDESGGRTNLNTLGIRQVFHIVGSPGTVSINLNHTWGEVSPALSQNVGPTRGWSLRAMFQVTF